MSDCRILSRKSDIYLRGFPPGCGPGLYTTIEETEVDDLINRLKTEHGEKLCERLAIATVDLQKAHQDHAEAFGRLKVDHEAYR